MWKTILLAGIVLGLSSCATVTRTTTISHNLQKEVDDLAQPLVDRKGTPGLVVGVLLPDGTMHLFGYGGTDQSRKMKPDGETLFATGSLSKEFLGALVSILVGEGMLSWNDTLGQFVSPSTPLSADAKKITLRQLATHTSGLPNQPQTFQTFRYFTRYLFTGESFYSHLDRDYVFHYLSNFKTPKRETFRYSNLGYGFLGYVIEERTGLSLDVLMDEKIIKPLGLRNTGYAPNLLPGYALRARGHAGDEPQFISRGRPVPDWQFTEFMKGTGGLYSNARDLLTFAAAHMDRPVRTPLNAALKDTLQAPIGWFVDKPSGRNILYQIGIVGGFSSYLGLDVDRQTAVVVLENSFHWKNRVGPALLARLGNVGT